jgi:hypothetical protein
MVFGALFYLVSSLIFLHHQAEILASTKIFGHLGGVVQNLVADVYQATSPYIGFVWEHAPTLSQENPLSYGNLLFFGLLGVMIIGKQILFPLANSRGVFRFNSNVLRKLSGATRCKMEQPPTQRKSDRADQFLSAVYAAVP